MKSRIWLISFIALFLLLARCENEKVLVVMNPWVTYGSMTDKDGNTYKTIPIGTQTWMVRNLKTTKFSDGTAIPVVTDPVLWSNTTSPACCWQNNDPIRKVTYGVLYNWYVVQSGKLCPVGWHVPTDEEWIILTDYLGGEDVAGSKLKEVGFTHWTSPNTGATDETHFSAFPGGFRHNGPDASFDGLTKNGYWWSATSGSDWASVRLMFSDSKNIEKSVISKQSGLSVRCVQNY
jgi:uncharacterized protein (TIGR02145 family)